MIIDEYLESQKLENHAIIVSRAALGVALRDQQPTMAA
jgi:hypothetical protein